MAVRSIFSKGLALVLAGVIMAGSYMTAGVTAEAAPQQYGFVQTDHGVMWLNQDGTFKTNDWLQFQGRTYHLDANGIIQTGFTEIDGNIYLLYPDGRVQTGWYQNENGIYNFGTDGRMVRNAVVEGFEIGPDGIVKGSGAKAAAAPAAAVSEKQQLVNQILAQVTTPDMTPDQKLAAAYRHILNITSYKRTYETPAGDWTWPYAFDIYSTGKGNCYRYAAAFAYLAKGLGYDVRVVTGMISAARGGLTPHGWVEINMGDAWYICDPDMQDAKGTNFYMKSYANYPVKPLNKQAEWAVNF